MKPTDEELTARTIKIIERHGHIFLKDSNGWYLSGWTNIAAGPDHAEWARRPGALEFFNLKWARTIAPLYEAKVVVVYPKKDKPSQNTGVPECTGLNCPVCAEADPDFPHKTAPPIHTSAPPDQKSINKTIVDTMKRKYGGTDMPAKSKRNK